MGKYSKNTRELAGIAEKRIRYLFQEASKEFNNDSSLSDRYVELARKISMKYQVKIPREFKRMFCKHCYSYLFPNKNVRIRLHGSKMIYHCTKCNNFMRYPFKDNLDQDNC